MELLVDIQESAGAYDIADLPEAEVKILRRAVEELDADLYAGLVSPEDFLFGGGIVSAQ